MDEQKMNDLMIDYIDGNLTGELKEFVTKYIEKNSENRRKYEELKAAMSLLEHDTQLEPDNSLKTDFMLALIEEVEAEHDRKVKPIKKSVWKLSPFQLAASLALIVSGVFIGMWLMKADSNNQQIAEIKKEMEDTKRLVIHSLTDNSSASRRLQGVNASYSIGDADDEIVNALIRTMNNDENANVRLAAVEALAKFADEPKVLNALIESMETQADPLIQITLINLMVKLKEKKALDELKRIIEDKKTMETVKDEAHMAVFKLS
ncbi:HEAT repeat domain-containing protein [Fulvivirga sp. 29W222]|uniref:HEAT repeat domain-containing protein n=1 Tax=Fulvivirga marina TaxID=2494733 RepID=A0A937FYT5_9BACT|nr:HEAT repeat domain-containing protein [Fulvivirga marina]MBL6447312.1 HEAT repeat domain-containing protein [Fulvivirga marina]